MGKITSWDRRPCYAKPLLSSPGHMSARFEAPFVWGLSRLQVALHRRLLSSPRPPSRDPSRSVGWTESRLLRGNRSGSWAGGQQVTFGAHPLREWSPVPPGVQAARGGLVLLSYPNDLDFIVILKSFHGSRAVESGDFPRGEGACRDFPWFPRCLSERWVPISVTVLLLFLPMCTSPPPPPSWPARRVLIFKTDESRETRTCPRFRAPPWPLHCLISSLHSLAKMWAPEGRARPHSPLRPRACTELGKLWTQSLFQWQLNKRP